jgi:hypothetical protein
MPETVAQQKMKTTVLNTTFFFRLIGGAQLMDRFPHTDYRSDSLVKVSLIAYGTDALLLRKHYRLEGRLPINQEDAGY